MKKFLPLIIMLASLLAFSPVVRANLIVNGGFETGTNIGWTVVPADIGSYCIVTPTLLSFGYTAQEGLYVVAFGAIEDSLDTIYQGFSTVVGKSYTFDFWVHNTAGWSGSLLLASWDPGYVSGQGSNPFLIAAQNDGSFGWMEYSFTQMASSSWTTIVFSGLSNADWIMVDNVSVNALAQVDTNPGFRSVKVPDASPTVVLLGLGLFVIAGLRRRSVRDKMAPARSAA
jgi:hypothetical protein